MMRTRTPVLSLLLSLWLVPCTAQLPSRTWSNQVDTDNSDVATPVYSDDGTSMYVTSDPGSTLISIATADGSDEWEYKDVGRVLASPCFHATANAGGPLVAIGSMSGNFGNVTVLDPAAQGAVLWTVDVGARVATDLAFSPSGAHLFVGTRGNRLIALDTTSGDTVWNVSACDGCVTATWASAPIVSADGSLVIVGGINGGTKTTALDADTGVPVWTAPFGHGVAAHTGTFASEDELFILTDDKLTSIFALDTATGDQKWAWQTTDAVHLSVPVSSEQGGVVVACGTPSGELSAFIYGLRTSDGALLWTQPVPQANLKSRPALSPDGRLFVAVSSEGTFYGVDTMGVERWQYEFDEVAQEFDTAPALSATGLLAVGSRNSMVYTLQVPVASDSATSLLAVLQAEPFLSDFADIFQSPSMEALKAKLDGTGPDPSNFTLFAPNNDAITAFKNALPGGWVQWVTNVAPLVLPYLFVEEVVPSYALLPSQIMQTELKDIPEYVNLGPGVGQMLLVRKMAVEDVEVDTTDDTVVKVASQGADYRASNGIMHIIDTTVPLPPTKTTACLDRVVTFATLLAQLSALGLSDTVDNTAGITVFAPLNAAFADADLWYSKLDDEYRSLVLSYHIVPQVLYTKDLTDGQTLTTLSGDVLTVSVVGNSVFLTDGTVSGQVSPDASDLFTLTGVVHGLTSVLVPPVGATRTMLQNIVLTRDLHVLTEFLLQENMASARTALSAPGDFVAYMPQVVVDPTMHPSEPEPIPFLYHIVSSASMVQGNEITTQYLPTLLTDPEYVNLGPGVGQVIQLRKDEDGNETIVFGVPGPATSQSSVLRSMNAASSNGLVHILDRFILPPLNVSLVAQQAGLTLLDKYAISAGLKDYIDTRADITIFAPSNEAFIQAQPWVDKIIPSTLQTVLQYHIVQGRHHTNSLTDGQTLNTVAGETLTVSVDEATGAISIGNGVESAAITVSDVLTQNGCVHVVDALLSPPFNEARSVAYNLGLAKPFSEVVSLLEGYTTLFAMLNDETEDKITFLAPSDDVIDVDNPPTEAELLYHVLVGEHDSFADTRSFIETRQDDPTLVHLGGKGQTMQIQEKTGGGYEIRYSLDGVVDIDDDDTVVKCSNGMFRGVAGIAPLPASMGDVLTASGLDALVQLAQQAGYDVEGPAGITLFGPSNAGLDSVSDWLDALEQPYVTTILDYHVVPSVVYASMLSDGMKLDTLRPGQQLEVSIVDGQVFLLGMDGPVALDQQANDIPTMNGVLHSIASIVSVAGDDSLDLLDNIFLTPTLSITAARLRQPAFAPIVTLLSRAKEDVAGVTFMAPVDSAYDSFVEGDNYWRLETPDLFLYHIVDGSITIDAPYSNETGIWPAFDGPAFVDTHFTDPAIVGLDGQPAPLQIVRARPPLTGFKCVFGVLGEANDTADIVSVDVHTANGRLNMVSTVMTLPEAPMQVLLSAQVTSLEKVIRDGNSSDLLNDIVGLTLFAPLNQAVDDALRFSHLLDDVPAFVQRQTTDIDTSGLVLRSPSLQAVLPGGFLTMRSGDRYKVVVDPNTGQVRVGGATIIQSDAMANNGIIHITDTLLDPVPSPTPPSKLPGIIAASAGAAVGGVLLTVGVYWFCCRNKKGDSYERLTDTVDSKPRGWR